MFRVRALAWILILAICLVPLCACGEGTWYGNVVCEDTLTVQAPFGGKVKDIAVRPGGLIRVGDQICTIETTKVYAPADGTVAMVYAQPGDNLETVKDLYGCALTISRTERFTLSASTRKAEKNEGCYVTAGQTVYLETGKGKTLKTGTGYILSVSSGAGEGEAAGDYKVRITSGSFYLDEKVTIFRTEKRGKDENLGQGTVEQTPAIEMTAEGSVLRMHVSAGDAVKRGDLLFETVAGTLDGLIAPDNIIVSGLNGIVSTSELTDGGSVEKGATLITLYPMEKLQVAVTLSEPELQQLSEGSAVKLTFGLNGTQRSGTVASINYAAVSGDSASSGYASYKVYIDFEADETVRLGMLVAVEMP